MNSASRICESQEGLAIAIVMTRTAQRFHFVGKKFWTSYDN